MPELTLKRIPFTETADKQLRMLKARTGLSANILCRLGFCLSLEEPGEPPKLPKNFHVGREINRYTLLGEYDRLFFALLVAKLIDDQLETQRVNDMFLAHMNRGVEHLLGRIKNVCDIAEMDILNNHI